MGNHKFCPNCGHPVQENSRFCQECGTPLANTGVELATRRQSWNESAPAQNQPPQQNTIVVHNQQPRDIVIDVTPLEERPQYRKAMRIKRSAKNWFIATAIVGCIFIYYLCSPADSWWESVGRNFSLLWWGLIAVCLFFVALKKWNKHKNLLEMSTEEYYQELQKIEQQKQVATNLLSGFAQGFVEGYINEKLRK